MIFLRLFCGSFVQIAPFTLLCIYPFMDRLKLSKKKMIVFSIFFIVVLCSMFAITSIAISYFVDPTEKLLALVNVVFLFCLIPCYIGFSILINDIWQKKVFIFSFSATSALVMTSICNIYETSVVMERGFDGFPYNYSTVFTLSIMALLIVPLLILLLKYCYKPIELGLSKKESNYLVILSILLLVFLAVGVSILDFEKFYNNPSLFLFISLMIFTFVIYYFLFRLIGKTQNEFQIKYRLNDAQHQLELRFEQYKRINDNIENSRKIRHDLRHHIVTLQGFVRLGDVAGASRYLEQYSDSLDKLKVEKISENIVVDSILGHYKFLTMKNDINFSIRVNIPSSLEISDIDLSVLLGNLLENAIEGVLKTDVEDKFILFNMITSGNMLVITIENNCNDQVRKENDIFLSSKENHTGIGIQSVKNIVEKYDGSMKLKVENSIFYSHVILRTLK